MKKLLFIIALALSTMARGQEFGELNQKQAEITYKDSTGFYVIKFAYNDSFCTVPLTNPLGCPHYSAMITVYEVTDGDTVVIGKPFSGTYTAGKCYEDEPAGLVDQAKKLRDEQIESKKLGEALKTDTTGVVWDNYKASRLTTLGVDSLISFGTVNTWNNSYADKSTPVYDTIPVIMLVCDTTQIQSADLIVYSSERLRLKETQPVFWISGYEVRKWKNFDDDWNMRISETGKEITGYWEYHAYLTSDKKPVKYVVWMSR